MVREIQPTHRGGMGLKAIKQNKKTKSWGGNQRIDIRRSIKHAEGDKGVGCEPAD